MVEVLLRGEETICCRLEAPAAAAAQEQKEEQSRWLLHGDTWLVRLVRLRGWMAATGTFCCRSFSLSLLAGPRGHWPAFSCAVHSLTPTMELKKTLKKTNKNKSKVLPVAVQQVCLQPGSSEGSASINQ